MAEETHPPLGSSFGTQLLAVGQKTLLLKRGGVFEWIVEMLLPGTLMGILAIVWLATDIVNKAGREFMNKDVIDIPEIMDAHKCVADWYEGPDIYSPVRNRTYCKCNTLAPLPCVGDLCLDTTGDALTLFEIALSYEGPQVIPDFDTIVLIHQAAKMHLIGSEAEFGNRGFGTAVTVGYKTAVVAGSLDPNVVRRVEEFKKFLSEKTVTFRDTLLNFTTEDQFVDYSHDVGQGQLMAGVVIHGEFTYTIRANRTATPPTLSERVLGDPSGLLKSYQKYLAGGFLTVQRLVDAFWISNVGGTDDGAILYHSIAPFPIPDYTEDEFLAMAGGFLPLVVVMGYLHFVSQYVSAIVREKEDKIKEGMLVMGLSSVTYKLSWYLLGIFQSLVSSLVLTGVLQASYMSRSNFFILFLLSFLFSLNISAMSLVIASFFSKAQTAGIAAPCLFLMTVIPRFAVPEESNVQLLNFLGPYAYSRGFATAAQMETGLR